MSEISARFSVAGGLKVTVFRIFQLKYHAIVCLNVSNIDIEVRDGYCDSLLQVYMYFLVKIFEKPSKIDFVALSGWLCIIMIYCCNCCYHRLHICLVVVIMRVWLSLLSCIHFIVVVLCASASYVLLSW